MCSEVGSESSDAADRRHPSLDERWDPAVVMAGPDPRWRELGIVECDRLLSRCLDLVVRVEHVGSTAVPGMVAKPIIDLQVSMTSGRAWAAVRAGLEQAGYTYVPTGDDEYRLLVKPWARPRSHHVHVCVAGSRDDVRHVAVRDYLRASAPERSSYAELKTALVAAAPGDRLSYIAGKASFLRGLESRALRWAGRTDLLD